MPAAARMGDPCTGHDCFPPRASVSGSPDVYINGIPALREGDGFALHKCTHPQVPHGVHDSVLAAGCPDVFVNDRQKGRVDDPVACGGSVASGSDDVFVG